MDWRAIFAFFGPIALAIGILIAVWVSDMREYGLTRRGKIRATVRRRTSEVDGKVDSAINEMKRRATF